jgi:HEAT repeat protein
MSLSVATILALAVSASSIPAVDVRPFDPEPTVVSGEDQARTADAAKLYEEGRDALGDERWERALRSFDEVIKLRGQYADAAMFWKAYSLNKMGRGAEALTVVSELTKAHPDSKWTGDGRALELEIRQASGQPMKPDSQADEELKLLALQGLQHQDPEQAIPLLEKFLQGNQSPRLQDRALFVLAQSGSPRARQIMADIARGKGSPQLQRKAIQYLGVHGSRENRQLLYDIYGSSTDIDIKKRILQAFMVSGERDRILAAATGEQNPELRKAAIQQLGVMGAQDALWQLYQKEESAEVKKTILQGMFVGGGADRLTQIAKTEKDPSLRKTAIHNLGLMGSKRTADTLIEIYNSDRDPEVKKTVIGALFVQGNADALVALARKEPDIEMKKRIVSQLSIMGGSRAAREYLMELLK